jgi:hypothetical protein
MLLITLTILGVAVLLAAVGILALRDRRVRTRYDDDRDAEDVAPMLYVPQPRNALAVSGQSIQPMKAPPRPVRPAAPPTPVATQPVPLATATYIAPAAGSAMDGVLQLLPGRLEPVGSDVGQEIRFIRQPGENKFTFGRSAGPAETHIQLLAPTASRMHAYMINENGRWRIGNMSETNRVLVNGEALESGDADRWLHDGDRIELGEVAFVFRER